jgi:hypothetical protein
MLRRMASQRIQLYDLLEGVVPYEPRLLRTPMRTEDLMPEQIVSAAAKTAKDILRRSGAPDIEVTEEDAIHAEEAFQAYVEGDKSALTPSKLQKPETIIKLEALVSEYDWKVIQHADQIRMLVTNKLLQLSDYKDPKIQIKAVELLGKLADVGMFVEKQEITYKQRTDEEIDAALNEKLGLLIEGNFETVEETPTSALEKPKPVTKPVENASKGTMNIAPLPETPKIDLGELLGG